MYELQVEGMSCNHCVSKVTRSVKKIDESAKVDVDLGAKKVRVESTADLEDVSAAIADAGYPVKASNVAQ
jgi:copper ion binding protein